MTLEIIIFVLAILLGIVLYWRESKSNAVYRFINKLTHNDELQMKPDNRKGFIHLQPFLMRLVYISILYIVAAVVLQFVTPIQAFVQYFVSAIVGTIIGTYIASAFLFAKNSTKKENLEKVFDKGKEMVQEFTEDVKETFDSKEESSPTETKEKPKQDAPPKKSARDRFKDKGMIK